VKFQQRHPQRGRQMQVGSKKWEILTGISLYIGNGTD